MKIIPVLNGMLVLTPGIVSSVQQARAQQKPHIILIMADQHRSDALGCMGNPAVISPNIDKLSEEGTLFWNGISYLYCVATRPYPNIPCRQGDIPVSNPARAGVLLGVDE